MRTEQWRTLALAAMLGMGAAGAQAALQGRDLDGNAATFEAYYDTTQNISWLADIGAGNAGFNWTDAVVWTGQLSLNGVTGWRLPKTPVHDSTCVLQDADFSGGYGCTGVRGVKWDISLKLMEFRSHHPDRSRISAFRPTGQQTALSTACPKASTSLRISLIEVSPD